MSVLTQLIAELNAGTLKIVDLTQPLGPDTPVIGLPPIFASSPGVSLETISRFDEKGPAWYWNDGAAQRGSQFRLDVLDKDEKIALGAMARLTLIPASQGVRRDMYAFGLYLRFR